MWSMEVACADWSGLRPVQSKPAVPQTETCLHHPPLPPETPPCRAGRPCWMKACSPGPEHRCRKSFHFAWTMTPPCTPRLQLGKHNMAMGKGQPRPSPIVTGIKSTCTTEQRRPAAISRRRRRAAAQSPAARCPQMPRPWPRPWQGRRGRPRGSKRPRRAASPSELRLQGDGKTGGNGFAAMLPRAGTASLHTNVHARTWGGVGACSSPTAPGHVPGAGERTGAIT